VIFQYVHHPFTNPTHRPMIVFVQCCSGDCRTYGKFSIVGRFPISPMITDISSLGDKATIRTVLLVASRASGLFIRFVMTIEFESTMAPLVCSKPVSTEIRLSDLYNIMGLPHNARHQSGRLQARLCHPPFVLNPAAVFRHVKTSTRVDIGLWHVDSMRKTLVLGCNLNNLPQTVTWLELAERTVFVSEAVLVSGAKTTSDSTGLQFDNLGCGGWILMTALLASLV
jgi:hypothetical protein